MTPPLVPIAPFLYEIPTSYRPDMRVPARVVADEALLQQIERDRSLEQLVNVTTLPGVAAPVLGMPDMHEGYGFPVGGVAATRADGGVISPGGIGFDINCGVRLLASDLPHAEVADALPAIVHDLARSVPAGFGRGGKSALDRRTLEHVLAEGCPYLVRELGLGLASDLERIESGGALADADPKAVSAKARERGGDQLGTLGSGNHFLEVQRVERVFDAQAAQALGIREDAITVLIHSGSRGLGHQVCTDAVREMDRALARYRITLPDRQLACAPLDSPEGRAYFAAMCAAANFGFSNRHLIAQRVREVFERALGAAARLRLVYDVAHNIAKLETHDGERLCVHRKGATRAFGPASREIPAAYRGVGQPVLIPGSMGTASYLLVGTAAAHELSLGSACHGAGRTMSRKEAKQKVTGPALRKELEAQGIVVRCASNAELAEEAPLAYKDVDQVVGVVDRIGIARKVARLRPLGVVKG